MGDKLKLSSQRFQRFDSKDMALGNSLFPITLNNLTRERIMKEVNGYKVFTADELAKILKEHAEWLVDCTKGKRADLTWADLTWADLSRANLSWAALSRAKLLGANLSWAALSGADLSWADLTWADLSRANLLGANLSWADLDYASFPFHCGGSNFKCSAKLVYQFLAHVYTFNPSEKSEEKEFAEIKKLIKPFAKKSHRWEDLVKE